MRQGTPWTKKKVKEFAEELSAVTVPINVTFEGKQRILDLTQVERVLRDAKTIAVADCECRTRVKGCDAPVDVCLYLNEEATKLVKKGKARISSLDEALGILKKTCESGLVHIAYTDKGDEKPNYICSCCSCCCHSFAAIQKFGFHDALISSDMIAVQDDDLCDDCGVCVDRCHFKARMIEKGVVMFDSKECFGCGLCVTVCPTGAISLARR